MLQSGSVDQQRSDKQAGSGRWIQVEDHLIRGAPFLGAIFIAIGFGEFLFVVINKPRLPYGSGFGGFPSWEIGLCLAFWILLTIRSRDPGLRITALVLAISTGLSLCTWVSDPGATVWSLGNAFDIIVGVTLVMVGRRTNGPKAKIAAILLWVGILAFKYFAMLYSTRVWERYGM